MALRLTDLEQRIERLPAWARPPFYGMFLVYGMVAARALIGLPILIGILVVSGPAGILKALWLLIVAGLAGFGGGIVFALASPVLKHLGRIGALAKGWICVFTYLVVLLPAVSPDDPRRKGYFDAHDPGDWILVALLSVFFGSIIGMAFVDDERGRRRRERWTQRSQRVTSRNHPPATDKR